MTSHTLAFDIGGTKIAAALVATDGTVQHIERTQCPAEDGDAIIETCIALGAKLRDESVTHVGISTAGQVDVDNGVIVYGSSLANWTGQPIANRISEALSLPTRVDNDVNCMALGEWKYGAARGIRNALFVAVGTGTGGALILNNQLYRGHTWSAGDVCHTVLSVDGDRICDCGHSGHLESYTSGPAMEAAYAQRRKDRTLTHLPEIADRAHAGDSDAHAVIKEGARLLGLGLSGLMAVLDPEMLVIGGGVADLDELWWEPLRNTIANGPLPGPSRVNLCKAELGTTAQLAGAATLAQENS